MGNDVTVPALVNNCDRRTPNSVTTAGFVVECQKINTIANILAACVNTSGADERYGDQDAVRKAVRLHRRTAR